MKKTFASLLFVIIINIVSNFSFAQTDSSQYSISKVKKIYIIKTVNGRVLTGTIIEDNENGIFLQSSDINMGKIRIPKYDIESMKEVEAGSFVNGMYKPESLFSTRHAFTTNGLPMKKGDAYFHTFYFLFYDVEYAVSNEVSIGAMTSFYGAPFLLSLKYSKEIQKDLHLGLGLLAGPLLLFKPSTGFITVPYGSLTFGGRRNNFTLTGGYPNMSIENSGSGGKFVVSIGGMAGISKSSFFVFDSFIFNAGNMNFFFLMPGIRVENQRNANAWSFHLGAAGANGEIVPLPVPVITYAHAFD